MVGWFETGAVSKGDIEALQPVWDYRRKGVRSKRGCRLWFLGPILLSIAGCTTVGPDFVTPTAPSSDAWIDDDDPSFKLETEAQDYPKWWETFDDPVLNSLVERAYEQNLTLQVAGLRILESRALLGVAVGEQYPQNQNAVGSYRRVEISENAANASFLDRDFGSLTLGVDTAWEIDFWGRFRRGVEYADAQLGATVASYDDLLVTLTAQVATTYVLIRELEERLVLARRNVDLQRRTLDIATVRFENGEVNELDVVQARALLGDTRARIPALESLLRQAKNALSVLLGQPPSKLRDIFGEPGKIPKAPEEIAIGIPTELLRRRPDIRNAELQAAAQSARIGIAKANLYPRFTLGGFIGFNTSDNGGLQSNNADLGDLFKGGSFTGFIGPSFSWPILNYGRLANNVRAQDSRFQQLVINYQDSVLRAYQEVEDGLVAFLKSQEVTRHLSGSVRASRRSAELSLLQYREGLVDYTRVLDTQSFLVAQQDRQAESRGAIARSLINTYKALGGGWETRDPSKAVPEAVQEDMQARTNWGDLLPAGGLDEAPSSGEELRDKQKLFRKPDW
ncbi:MAG: efflux transporter outer membrane subunit [Geminicoccaceae bacterium]